MTEISETFKPNAPLMGGLEQVGAKEWCPWVGGKPNATWTGLEEPNPARRHDYQLRPTSPGSAQKSTAARQVGLATKFKKGAHFLDFIESVRKVLITRGMDTITYLPSPTDPSKMLCILDHHAKYTIDQTVAFSKELSVKYDRYDEANDVSAKEFLLNSVDDELYKETTDRISVNSSFATTWIQLVTNIQSTCYKRFQNIKRNIELESVKKYAGQDIKKLSTRFLDYGRELENYGLYEHELTLTMIEKFVEAGGASADPSILEFRMALLAVKKSLDTALLEIGRMEASERDAYIVSQRLTYRHICATAEEEYKKLFDNNRWPPAKSVHDTATPGNFGANNVVWCTPVGSTPPIAMTLMQQNAASTTKDQSLCHNCNKPGHWKRDCPELKKNPRQKPRTGNSARSQTGRTNARSNSGSGGNNWKSVPPNASHGDRHLGTDQGHPKWQKERNGRTFYWCATCNSWSTSHFTGTHRGKRPDTKNTKTAAPQANTASFPDAWASYHAYHLDFTFTWSAILRGCYLVMLAFVTPLWNEVVTIMMPHALALPPAILVSSISAYGWGALAPFVWISSFLLFLWAKSNVPPVPPPEPPRVPPRKTRRRQDAIFRRFQRDIFRPLTQSIRTEGFHRRYPRPLRVSGNFARRPTPPRFRPANVATAYHYRPPLPPRVHRQPREGVVQSAKPTMWLHKTYRAPVRTCTTCPAGTKSHTTRTCTKKSRSCHPMEQRAKPATPAAFNKWESRKSDESSRQREKGYATKAQYHAVQKIMHHANMVIATPTLPTTMPPQDTTSAIRIALTHPHAFKANLATSNFQEIIWDSGASISISFDRNDFVGPLHKPSTTQKLIGIAKGLKIEGHGHVLWSMEDTSGHIRRLKVPALLVPQAKVRLLSIPSLLKTHPSETMQMDANEMRLSGDANDASKGCVIARINPTNNLPMSIAYSHDGLEAVPKAFHALIKEVNERNFNLPESEKEWLRWHYRLAHMGFRRLQLLLRTGVLATSQAQRRLHTQICKLTHPPKCAACQFAKAHRKPSPGTKHKTVQDRRGVIKSDNLLPGQEVSVDHFICSTKGRLYTSFGKSEQSSMYSGGAIFIDQSSDYVYVALQVSMSSHETLQSKEKFESVARDFGVTIQKYLSDNGSAFTSKDFQAHLHKFEQTIRFAGVGAHHHNGHAENAIKCIMSLARTMMLHAAIHWPTVADPQLWPMAVQYAVYIWNHMPKADNGLSPHDLFTRQRWPQQNIHHLHVCGCPSYVLDKRIADGKKIPRWESRSTRQVFMGFSPRHATTVPLVLNTDTHALTSQFHVVFDDWFATVATALDALPDFNSPAWSELFGATRYQYPTDDDEEPEPDLPTSDYLPSANSDRASSAYDRILPPQPLNVPPPAEVKPAPLPVVPTPTSQPTTPVAPALPVEREPTSPVQREPSQIPAPVIAPPTPSPDRSSPPEVSAERERDTTSRDSPSISVRNEPIDVSPSIKPTSASPPPVQTPRRSTRTRHQPVRFGYDGSQQAGYTAVTDENFQFVAFHANLPAANIDSHENFAFATTPCFAFPSLPTARDPYFEQSEHAKLTPTHPTYTQTAHPYNNHTIGAYNMQSLHLGYTDNAPKILCMLVTTDLAAFKASTSDPDTLTWDQAMADAANRDKWLEAALLEIRQLEGKLTWEEVPLSTAVTKVIPGTWIFRIKRYPDGRIKKFKARWAVRGDLQEVNFDVYAPVVAWSSVRIFMTFALTVGWVTCSIDFDNAFVQSTLRDPVWVHLPRGFRSMLQVRTGDKAVLKLRKSLYGLAVAPKLWYETLMAALIGKLGFKASSYDRCFLYKKDMIMVTFVDDCGIAAKNEELIDKLIKDLRDLGFALSKEGSFTEFLGVAIEPQPDGTLHMKQCGLIDKILEATSMSDANPNRTPASQVALGSFLDSAPFKQHPWRYSSIVGMLLYLTTNTRPDCAYAVSQVARFSSAPKVEHATAVKMIVRYLLGSRDKGMFVRPTGTFDLDCWADADFGGRYKSDPDHDPNGARSRAGYIITLGNVPLFWKSQLVSTIAVSTQEAEYYCLSIAIRNVLAIKLLIEELLAFFDLPALTSTIRCTVFEDNNGALILATKQQITSRTKYYHVKWHHFWESVREGNVQVKKVDTKEQRADYLTKGLVRDTFETIRKMVQGW